MASTVATDDAVVVRPSGFVSYVHKDNSQSGGRVLRLISKIEDEFSLTTGEDLEFFVDRTSLEWGDQWRQRIESALQDTTFFVPIVTPRFFQSVECRSELMKFAGYARSLGAEELLLPVLFVDVDDLNEDSSDEVKSLIASTQYVDWTKLRLSDEESAEYVQAVSDLARRLATVSADYSAKASVVPTEGSVAANSVDTEDDWGDTEPGFMDYLVEVEEILPRWQQNLFSFPEPLREITEHAQLAGEKMKTGEAKGKTLGYRILVARDMAKEIDDPAGRLQQNGQEYVSNLVDLDPGVRSTISLAGTPDFPEEHRESAREMFRSLLRMISSSRSVGGTIEGVIESFGVPAKQYKDLRPPLKKMRAGLRSFLDGQAIYDEWERLIRASPIYTPDLELDLQADEPESGTPEE